MKIGYISRRKGENGKETFKYKEGTATRRIGVRTDTVKTKFLYGTFDYEEVLSNTKYVDDGKGILVGEPFFTDEEKKKRLEKWCEWANSCEHREYSFFGEVEE